MYGGLFAFAVMAVTTVMAARAFIFYRETIQTELTETVAAVGRLITSGVYAGESSVEALQIKKEIRVSVLEMSAGRVTENPTAVALRMTRQPEWYAAPAEIRRSFFVLSEEGFFRYFGRMYFVKAYRDDGWAHQTFGVFGVAYIILLAAGVAGAFTVGRLVSRKMLRPVTEMIDLASQISIEDLGRRIATDGPNDEIGMLARAFNDMIGRLEESFDKQNRFISDASHELRTPVSVIQGYANLIGRWGKNDPEILAESIDSIVTETEHMSTLIKKLLFIAGRDGGARKDAAEEVSLNACLKEIVKETGVLGPEHRVGLVEDAEVTVTGDYILLKQAFWIFIENSMKYAKNGAADIVITVRFDNGDGVVSIKDDGIGIRSEDLPFIFDRFYKSDKSRGLDASSQGIGLFLVKSIVNAHGGSIDVESEEGSWIRFTVELKLAR